MYAGAIAFVLMLLLGIFYNTARSVVQGPTLPSATTTHGQSPSWSSSSHDTESPASSSQQVSLARTLIEITGPRDTPKTRVVLAGSSGEYFDDVTLKRDASYESARVPVGESYQVCVQEPAQWKAALSDGGTLTAVGRFLCTDPTTAASADEVREFVFVLAKVEG